MGVDERGGLEGEGVGCDGGCCCVSLLYFGEGWAWVEVVLEHPYAVGESDSHH